VVNAPGTVIRAFGAPDLRNTLRERKNIDVGLLQRQQGVGTSSAVGDARFQIPLPDTVMPKDTWSVDLTGVPGPMMMSTMSTPSRNDCWPVKLDRCYGKPMV
jgi:hypothetical protein